MAFEAAERAPVNLLMSGPAGGVKGAIWAAKQAGFDNVLTLRYGRHLDRRRASSRMARRGCGARPWSAMSTVRASSLDVRTVGAGGGSIAKVPELTRALRVGPDSAGAVPGPAAYGKRRRAPTVTDANSCSAICRSVCLAARCRSIARRRKER